VLTPSRRGRDSLAEGSTVDAGAVSKIAADRGAGFEPSVSVAKEPPSVWKGQLGNSRTVERGQSQKSVVPLGGTEGSNPAPSSAASGANRNRHFSELSQRGHAGLIRHQPAGQGFKAMTFRMAAPPISTAIAARCRLCPPEVRTSVPYPSPSLAARRRS